MISKRLALIGFAIAFVAAVLKLVFNVSSESAYWIGFALLIIGSFPTR